MGHLFAWLGIEINNRVDGLGPVVQLFPTPMCDFRNSPRRFAHPQEEPLRLLPVDDKCVRWVAVNELLYAKRFQRLTSARGPHLRVTRSSAP